MGLSCPDPMTGPEWALHADEGAPPGVKHGHPKDTFKPVITSVAFLGLHGMCPSTREVTVLRSGLDDGAAGRRYRRGSCLMSLI